MTPPRPRRRGEGQQRFAEYGISCHAPQAAIAFNSGPDDSADAARRWLTGA